MPSISWTWTRSSLRVFLNFPVSLNGIIQPVAQPVAWRIILDPFPSLILSLTVHQQALSIYFLNSSSPPSQSKPLNLTALVVHCLLINISFVSCSGNIFFGDLLMSLTFFLVFPSWYIICLPAIKYVQLWSYICILFYSYFTFITAIPTLVSSHSHTSICFKYTFLIMTSLLKFKFIPSFF